MLPYESKIISPLRFSDIAGKKYIQASIGESNEIRKRSE